MDECEDFAAYNQRLGGASVVTTCFPTYDHRFDRRPKHRERRPPTASAAAGHRAAALRGLAFLALLLPPGRPFGGARKADPVWPLNARKAASAAMARRILVLIFQPGSAERASSPTVPPWWC